MVGCGGYRGRVKACVVARIGEWSWAEMADNLLRSPTSLTDTLKHTRIHPHPYLPPLPQHTPR